jgi:hypothetical protein
MKILEELSFLLERAATGFLSGRDPLTMPKRQLLSGIVFNNSRTEFKNAMKLPPTEKLSFYIHKDTSQKTSSSVPTKYAC